jgi:hypothetical protein
MEKRVVDVMDGMIGKVYVQWNGEEKMDDEQRTWVGRR